MQAWVRDVDERGDEDDHCVSCGARRRSTLTPAQIDAMRENVIRGYAGQRRRRTAAISNGLVQGTL